jgi:hypothetical protein
MGESLATVGLVREYRKARVTTVAISGIPMAFE